MSTLYKINESGVMSIHACKTQGVYSRRFDGYMCELDGPATSELLESIKGSDAHAVLTDKIEPGFVDGVCVSLKSELSIEKVINAFSSVPQGVVPKMLSGYFEKWQQAGANEIECVFTPHTN